MIKKISKAWPALHHWANKQWNTKDEEEGYDPDAEANPSGRLHFNVILKHYQMHGP